MEYIWGSCENMPKAILYPLKGDDRHKHQSMPTSSELRTSIALPLAVGGLLGYQRLGWNDEQHILDANLPEKVILSNKHNKTSMLDGATQPSRPECTSKFKINQCRCHDPVLLRVEHDRKP